MLKENKEIQIISKEIEKKYKFYIDDLITQEQVLELKPEDVPNGVLIMQGVKESEEACYDFMATEEKKEGDYRANVLSDLKDALEKNDIVDFIGFHKTGKTYLLKQLAKQENIGSFIELGPWIESQQDLADAIKEDIVKYPKPEDKVVLIDEAILNNTAHFDFLKKLLQENKKIIISHGGGLINAKQIKIYQEFIKQIKKEMPELKADFKSISYQPLTQNQTEKLLLQIFDQNQAALNSTAKQNIQNIVHASNYSFMIPYTIEQINTNDLKDEVISSQQWSQKVSEIYKNEAFFDVVSLEEAKELVLQTKKHGTQSRETETKNQATEQEIEIESAKYLNREIKELSDKEILKMPDDQAPYAHFSVVYNEKGRFVPAYQLIDSADSADKDLPYFTMPVLRAIEKGLEKSRVVWFYGTSRSSKTEMFLDGSQSPIGRENSFLANPDHAFVDILPAVISSLSYEEIKEQLKHIDIEKLSAEKAVIAFDEFDPTCEAHLYFIKELLARNPNLKVVLTIGGYNSNDLKRSHIQKIDDKVFQDAPRVEITHKPLGPDQLKQWFQNWTKWQTSYSHCSPEEQENILVNFVSVIEFQDKYPLIPRMLQNLMTNLVAYRDKQLYKKDVEKLIADNLTTIAVAPIKVVKSQTRRRKLEQEQKKEREKLLDVDFLAEYRKVILGSATRAVERENLEHNCQKVQELLDQGHLISLGLFRTILMDKIFNKKYSKEELSEMLSNPTD